MYSDERTDQSENSQRVGPLLQKSREGNPKITSPQLFRSDSRLPQKVKEQGGELLGVRMAEEMAESVRRNTKTQENSSSRHPLHHEPRRPDLAQHNGVKRTIQNSAGLLTCLTG